MDRSRWLGVFVGLAWTGLAWSQPGPAPTPPSGGGARFLTVQELDRPAQRCRIVKSWRQPDGSRAFQVESVNGGGTMTIVESAAPSGPGAPGAPRALKTRIYHWGPGNMPPPEAPKAPAGEEVGRLTPRPAPAPAAASAPAPAATSAPAGGGSGFWPPAYAGQKSTPFHTMNPVGPVSSKQAPASSRPSQPRLTPSPAIPRTVVATPAINTRDPAIPPPPGRLVSQGPTPPHHTKVINSPDGVRMGQLVAQGPTPQSPYQPGGGPATPIPRAAGSAPATPSASPSSPYSVVQRPGASPAPAGTANPPAGSSYNVLPGPGSTCAGCQGSGGWNNRPLNGGQAVAGCNGACCGCPTCGSGCCPIKKRTLCDRLFCRRKEPAPMRTACGELLIVPLPPEAGSCVTCAPPTPPKTTVAAPCPPPAPVCCCPPPCAPCSICPVQPPCMVEEKPTLRERFLTRRHEEKPVPVTAAGERLIEVPSGDPCKVVTMPAPEKPPRPSLFSRLRRSSAPTSTLIPGSENLPPPQAPVVKAPTEQAQPGDFRGSWGNADPHQPTPIARGDLTPRPRPAVPSADPRAAQVQTQPPAALPSTLASRATPATPSYGVGVPVQEGNAFSDAPPKPAAKPEDNQGPNPTNAFSDGGGGGPGGPPSGQQAGGGSPRPMMITPPPPPLVLDPREPHDMHNAFTLAASTRRMIPADAGAVPIIPNAFSPGTNGNSFSIMPSLMPPAPAGPQQATATGQQQPASRPAVDARQVASSRYGPDRSAAPSAALERPEAVPPEQSQSDHWLVTLQESVYPSEREWAAERLGRLDWRTEPRIVEALVKTAREDAAPTVRAACVRTLVRMKVNSPLVLTQVRALQDDSDARVRQEVEQALGVLLTEPARRPE